MSTSRWKEVRRLFDEASELPDSERDAFIAAANTSPEILREVRSLLSQLQEDPGFLEAPTVDLPAARPPLPWRQIGPWRLVDEVGQGGMGTVYRAVKTGEGFEKTVALKVIRPGMNMAFAVEHFLAERQILASLDHPHIAKLFDGGTTPEGLPYFVMEFIEGETLVAWADRRGLNLHERIDLFRPICAAVHYAHQHLVVHRDIKPGNVLVTPDGTPKLLDFGLAKLIDPQGAGELDKTATAFRMLTPEYASPEQVRGDRITTPSDVYSLGVLLYRLLAGRGPYRVTTQTPQALVHAVLEQEPESVRGTLGEDLDTILAMSMRKEPERRYASAEDLSEDLRRYLQGLPVHARKATPSYRLSKFVTRHRVAVAAALLISISLIGGAGMALWQAKRARESEALAQRRFNDIRKLANEYLFEFHDAIHDLPGATRARSLVIRRGLEYLDRLSADAGDDLVLVEELAAAYERLGELQAGGQAGQVESNLGDNAGAVTSFEKAVALREKVAAKRPDGLGERRALANACAKLALARAHSLMPAPTVTPLFEKAHTLLMDVVSRAPLDRDAGRDLAFNHRHLAALFDALGEPSKALAAAREEARLFGRLTEEDPRNEADRRQNGIALQNLGSRLPADEAAPLLQKAFETAEELLRREPMSVERQLDMADSLSALGANAVRRKDDRAEANYRRALEIRTEVAGRDTIDARPQTGLAQSHLALAHLELRRGRPDHAAEEAASGLGVIGRFRVAHPDDLRARALEASLLAALAAVREAQAKDAAPAARRARMTQARDLYAKSRELYQQVVATVPVAAKMAAAREPDIKRCEAALAALPER